MKQAAQTVVIVWGAGALRRCHGRPATSQSNCAVLSVIEPTVDLHMADVERLIRVLHRLVVGGHSVVEIEHDLDVLAETDWVIDLRPEGGAAGGKVVCAGPRELLVARGTHTGVALRLVLVRG